MANESVPITAASHIPADGPAQRYLVIFRLEAQVYALPVEAIIQIIEMVAITPIPQINPVVKGVINLRGEAVPVLNLRRYWGLPEVPLHLHTPIILIHNAAADEGPRRQKAGLIVDEVLDVMAAREEAISSLPGVLPEGLQQAPLVQGLVHTTHGLIVLLAPEQLFAPDQAPLLPAKILAPQTWAETPPTPENSPAEVAV